MYATGTGVPQDFTEAARWHRLAADQGDAAGQFNLGVMYATGTRVLQDYTEAARWCWLAAIRQTLPESHIGLLHNYACMVLGSRRTSSRQCGSPCSPATKDTRRPKPASASSPRIRVRIAGLAAATHLNGRLGTVVQPPTPLAAGRIAVRIDGQTKITTLLS